MEHNNTAAVELLTEIRDLLRIVAEANRPQYEAAVLERLGARADEIRALVKSKSQWDALELMDGTHTRGSISEAAGMDSGNLSRFASRLRASGVIIDFESGREKIPAAVYSAAEIRAMRSVSNV